MMMWLIRFLRDFVLTAPFYAEHHRTGAGFRSLLVGNPASSLSGIVTTLSDMHCESVNTFAVWLDCCTSSIPFGTGLSNCNAGVSIAQVS